MKRNDSERGYVMSSPSNKHIKLAIKATEKSVEDGTENMEDAKFKVKEETEYALYNSRLLPQNCITEVYHLV